MSTNVVHVITPLKRLSQWQNERHQLGVRVMSVVKSK